MDSVKLTDEQCQAIDADGYMVVLGALNADKVTGLTKVCDWLTDNFSDDPHQYYLQLR